MLALPNLALGKNPSLRCSSAAKPVAEKFAITNKTGIECLQSLTVSESLPRCKVLFLRVRFSGLG